MFEKGDIMETIRNVDVNRLHDFKNHPFKVEMNTELCELSGALEKLKLRLKKYQYKTHFEIYDPVGVYDSLNDVNTMKPVVVNPTTSFTQLLDGLSEINDDKQVEQQINQIIAKLQRKKRNMSPKMMDYFISMTDGKDPSQLIMEIEKSDVQEAKNRLLKYRDVFKMLQETKVFQNNLESIVLELNEYLYDDGGNVA